jgi:siderophore synthetase component
MTSNSAALSSAAMHLPESVGVERLLLETARLQAQAFKAAMRYQIEILSFLKHRFEQDVKLVDDVVSSDEFADAFVVYSDFMRNAAAEYSTETGKVAAIGSRLASQMAKDVRKGAQETVENLAASTVTA